MTAGSVRDGTRLVEAVRRVIFVLESEFPRELIPLRNALGIDVIDRVRPE